MKVLVVRTACMIFLMCYINESLAQGRINAQVTQGIATCEEVGCDESDPDLIGSDLNCLDCIYLEANRVMDSILNKKKTDFKKNKMNFEKVTRDQNKWAKDVERLAQKESDQYKGGRMEMEEYVRTKLKLTNLRIEYLMSL